MKFAVALLVALAVWLALVPAPSASQRLRKLRVRQQFRGKRVLPLLGIGLASAVIGSFFNWSIGMALAAISVTAVWVWQDQRGRKLREKRSDQVFAGCRALAGLLRLGHVPAAALAAIAAQEPLFVEAAAVHRVGGEIAPVLRRSSQIPGLHGLAELAIAWELSEKTGASLTATLDTLAARMKAEAETAATVRAELAAPRSTSRLLAALPVVGIGLGYGMGGDPLAFLTSSIFGEVTLILGVVLACAGVWWSELIAASCSGTSGSGASGFGASRSGASGSGASGSGRIRNQAQFNNETQLKLGFR